MKNFKLQTEYFFIYLLLIILLCNFSSLSITVNSHYVSQNESCFVVNNWSNRTFKLVWRDEFDKMDNLTENWIVTNETTETCNGNWIGQNSCNVAKNVKILKGNMALFAQYEEYLERDFTAATVTTRDSFTHGRIEIRASLPLGRQIRTSFFTQNDTKTWHDNGQIDLMTRYDKAVLHRVVHYANSSVLNKKVNLNEDLDIESDDYLMQKQHDEFHVYGVEWNDQEVRFFLDGQYSIDSVFFDKVHEALATHHQISIQIGVGGYQELLVNFLQPIPIDFDNFDWQCPATIIDYIRIFENVDNLQEIAQLAQCDQTNQTDNESKIIDSICVIAMEEIENKVWRKNFNKKLKVVLIVIFICLVLIAIFYILVKIFSAKKKTSEYAEPHYSESHGEESIYDVPIYTEPSSSNLNQLESRSYLDLQDVNERSYLDLHDLNERSYLSLKDVVNSESNKYLPIWSMEKGNKTYHDYNKKLKQNRSCQELEIIKTSEDNSYAVIWSKKAASTEHLSKI